MLKNNTLILEPFQNKIAYVQIPVRREICNTAIAHNQMQHIKNIHAFDKHIAYNAANNSKIVLPLVIKNQIIDILNINSTIFDHFTNKNKQGLHQLMAQLKKMLATTNYKKFFASIAK